MSKKSRRELRKIGRGVFHGTTVLRSAHPDCFMLAMLFTAEQIAELEARNVVELYALYEWGLGHRGVNGMPVFPRFDGLTKKELRVVRRWWIIEQYLTILTEEGVVGTIKWIRKARKRVREQVAQERISRFV